MSYIKLNRGITDWEWFTDDKMLKLWIYLLVNAQYQDGRFKGIDVKRGQVIVGRKKLAERLGMTEQQVRNCLNRLKSTSEITIKPTNKYSLITIVKYDVYQGESEENNQQTNQQTNQQQTNKQPTNNQQTTTIKEIKKDKKLRNKEFINNKDIEVFDTSPEFNRALQDFEEMRKRIRKPLTNRAKELILQKLEKLAPGDEQKKIEILDQSIMNSYQGVFELHNKSKKEEPKRKSYEEQANEWKNF